MSATQSRASTAKNRRTVVVPDAAKIWNLVQVSDCMDDDDLVFLKRHGIQIYQPLMRLLKPVPRNKLSHSQRKSNLRPTREKIEQFFPGYAFVAFAEAGELWREIFKMKRIRGLATTNNMPVQVPWKLIDELRSREVEGAIPGALLMENMPFLIGETVRVNTGAFAGFSAEIEIFPDLALSGDGKTPIEQLDDSHRVRLLVNIFGRQTPVDMLVADIDKL